MATKDHSLDQRIVEAARAEFLEHGFQKASLHKIAERAGLTTGALYTRYQNKDALFCSLVAGLQERVGAQLEPQRARYEAAQRSGSAREILEAIRQEERLYLGLLFDCYDECVLLFCRSGGSSVEAGVNRLMEEKARETVAYLRELSGTDLDLDGVELLMADQFHNYRQLLEKGWSREKAVACLKTVELFQEAGWKALFQHILGETDGGA